MGKVELTKTIEELKEKSRKYQHQVELRVLDNCPFIVQVGAMTITTGENGQITTQNSNYPTQFTQKAVDEILTMTFKKGNGDIVIPKVYTRFEWYQERLNELSNTLNILEPPIIDND